MKLDVTYPIDFTFAPADNDSVLGIQYSLNEKEEYTIFLYTTAAGTHQAHLVVDQVQTGGYTPLAIWAGIVVGYLVAWHWAIKPVWRGALRPWYRAYRVWVDPHCKYAGVYATEMDTTIVPDKAVGSDLENGTGLISCCI